MARLDLLHLLPHLIRMPFFREKKFKKKKSQPSF